MALDEELGENVRVTIIATGYEVNGLPMLDDEDTEGGKTIDEVIRDNYDKPSEPKEDEQPQVINFGETIFGNTHQEMQEKVHHAHPDAPEGDGLEIHIEDDDAPSSTQEPSRHPFGYWMHRR